MTSISTTPTPIFIPPPLHLHASPCYWAAAVAEFVAIFHRCHAPPPPPWLKHRHDSTLSSKSNKFAPHIFHDLYFVQCTLLPLFSVNIPKGCAWEKQKTSPGISTSFLLSPKQPTPGGSVANPHHRCLERLPPASPIRGECTTNLRHETSWMNFAVFYQMWLEMCTLASKLWVRFRPRHLQRPPEVTWDTARRHVGLLWSGYKMLMREWRQQNGASARLNWGLFPWQIHVLLCMKFWIQSPNCTSFLQTLKYSAELWKLRIVVRGEFTSIARIAFLYYMHLLCEIHIAPSPNLYRTFSRST